MCLSAWNYTQRERNCWIKDVHKNNSTITLYSNESLISSQQQSKNVVEARGLGPTAYWTPGKTFY